MRWPRARQPPEDKELQASLSHRSNCACFRGSQENSLEMQELKTVNWNFQVTPPPHLYSWSKDSKIECSAGLSGE